MEFNKLLAEVQLEPVQGSRFQPTGFPSLGPAEFSGADNNNKSIDLLLVESSQSMANRLEAVCLDGKKSSLVDALDGMPLVLVNDKDDKFLTNSLLEAHRLNSSYILDGSDKTVYDKMLEELGIKDKAPVEISKLASFAFKYDPNSILHGLFISRSEIAGGRYKMTRALSSFIEATHVEHAVSGGVKLDHVDPTGGDLGAKEGFGHIPYNKIEYTAKSIKAYFNIDLGLLRSYGLGEIAIEFLFKLSLWKIQSFLEKGLRLRSACDLKLKDRLKVTEPESFDIPDIKELEKDLKKLIKQCKDEDLFNSEPVKIKYESNKKK